jgi:hypothetical protein
MIARLRVLIRFPADTFGYGTGLAENPCSPTEFSATGRSLGGAAGRKAHSA